MPGSEATSEGAAAEETGAAGRVAEGTGLAVAGRGASPRMRPLSSASNGADLRAGPPPTAAPNAFTCPTPNLFSDMPARCLRPADKSIDFHLGTVDQQVESAALDVATLNSCRLHCRYLPSADCISFKVESTSSMPGVCCHHGRGNNQTKLIMHRASGYQLDRQQLDSNGQ